MSILRSGNSLRAAWPLGLALTFGFAGDAFGQAAAPAPTATKPAAAPQETIVENYLENEKTDVPIHLTYLPGSRGKETVPIILLHSFKGDRHEMEGLGLYLQSQGHAVIIPDLRGHGQSTTVLGTDRKLDANTMPPAHLTSMVTRDMNAVKRFIVSKHNAAELNVEKLGIVGAEMGAVVAVNWAALDWAAPDYPGRKQSKDVKALVLLSPTMAFKSLTIAQALNYPPIRDILSVFVITGAEDVNGSREARTIHSRLERARPKPTKIEEKTVFLEDTLKTKLTGAKLLGEKSLGVEQVIGQFIELRLVRDPSPWKDRS